MDFKSLLFSFHGRIGRQSWWLTTIGVNIVTSIIVAVVFAVLGPFIQGDGASPSLNPIVAIILFIIMLIVFVVSMWASLALQAKRWHDRDKSAWWILIGLIPIVGGIWALVECGFLRGTDGPNRFGEDPLR